MECSKKRRVHCAREVFGETYLASRLQQSEMLCKSKTLGVVRMRCEKHNLTMIKKYEHLSYTKPAKNLGIVLHISHAINLGELGRNLLH